MGRLDSLEQVCGKRFSGREGVLAEATAQFFWSGSDNLEAVELPKLLFENLCQLIAVIESR